MTTDTTRFRDETLPWHNPEKVPFDKLPEGRRFLLKEEIPYGGYGREVWVWMDGKWLNSTASCRSPSSSEASPDTYCVPWPLPAHYLTPVWRAASDVPIGTNCPSGYFWATSNDMVFIQLLLKIGSFIPDGWLWTPAYVSPCPPFIAPESPADKQKREDAEAFERTLKEYEGNMLKNSPTFIWQAALAHRDAQKGGGL